MWLDNDSPGCLYDVVDCSDCGGCNPSPLELYLEEEYDGIEEMEERSLMTCGGEYHLLDDKIIIAGDRKEWGIFIDQKLIEKGICDSNNEDMIQKVMKYLLELELTLDDVGIIYVKELKDNFDNLTKRGNINEF